VLKLLARPGATGPTIYPGAGVPLSTGTAWGTSFNNTTNPISVSYGGTGFTSLTAGYIPYGNGTGAFSSSANLYFSGINLGIGNSSPSYNLHIGDGTQYTAAVLNGPSTGTNQGAILGLKNGTTFSFFFGNKSALLGGAYDGTPYLYYASTLIFYDGQAGVNRAAFDSAGNLGIGVIPPTGNAVLELKAGSTVIAPLKLTSGTNLTTPVAGTVEY